VGRIAAHGQLPKNFSLSINTLHNADRYCAFFKFTW
jgi:hypothetical protein